MKTIIAFLLAAALSQFLPAYAQDGQRPVARPTPADHPGADSKTAKPMNSRENHYTLSNSPASGGGKTTMDRKANDWSNQTVQIDLSQPADIHHNNGNYPFSPMPDMGMINNTAPIPEGQPDAGNLGDNTGSSPQPQPPPGQTARPVIAAHFIQASPSSNVAHHHHPFTPGYIRKKLQKLGVTSLPDYITNRAEILDADKEHSTIQYPRKGPDKESLPDQVLASKDFNDPVVRDRMALLQVPGLAVKIGQMNQAETRPNHYYWHKDNGLNFCHYLDNWGYHWYGWYAGGKAFWIRDYGNRWWCYDGDRGRWCFWDNDWWWWQDPYHVGDLYMYNNGQYIPCDSSRDPVVTTALAGDETTYRSPDATRMVKLMTNGHDAFLFDTASPPSFKPIYLASQVTGVKFSDTRGGGPLQVMLTHGDGSVDLFDDRGNPLNFTDAAASDVSAPAGNGAPVSGTPQ